jgi:hypothetical protein
MVCLVVVTRLVRGGYLASLALNGSRQVRVFPICVSSGGVGFYPAAVMRGMIWHV